MKRTMALVLAGLLLSASGAAAGPERVAFPAGYQDTFVRYLDIDRPDRKTKRFFYVNPAALEAAQAGAPLPDGTVLVMEDHPAELDGETPRRDAEGRFIAAPEVRNVFVMEKRTGWGAAFPAGKRNGDWDYAWYDATGKLKHSDPARYEGCFNCHQSRAERDYTFTFFKYVDDLKR
ncbi:cytochrome P460 family protein [Pelagibius sp. CAU 1746]|uniref:cytochrome P460 family protein n=1 Tax=Pelagibius sp. CAU 1746 TaxID=3140370 RepID=UPI00325C221E